MADETEFNRQKIRRLQRALAQVRLSIDASITLPMLDTFLTVALNEGKSLTELAQLLGGASKSTTSRHLLELSDHSRTGGDGYGLVERRTNPTNLRENTYTLTRKGRNLINQIEAQLED